MRTVSNEKISVTVSDEMWEIFKPSIHSCAFKQTLPSGDVRFHDPEKVVRGRILSHAMAVLGNQFEAQLLDREKFTLSDEELQAIKWEAIKSIQDHYVQEFLTEHTKYKAGETFFRYQGGHRLSQGMEFELDEAMAYARAATSELDYKKLYFDISEKYSEFRTRMILNAAKQGADVKPEALTVDDQMASIIAFKQMMFEIERRYRHRFDNSEFQITVLRPDLMPEQIGLCSYGESL